MSRATKNAIGVAADINVCVFFAGSPSIGVRCDERRNLERQERFMDAVKNDEIRQAVRRQYGRVAESDGAGCGCGPTCCETPTASAETLSQGLGYTADDVGTVPQGANMGLGCGNPQAIARLKPGEIVLDLGSGGGFDCFLAALQVGDTGRVIGVDMTPEMISKARANAERGGYRNIEFRLGEIENLPVADGIVDVIISNCVINLSPDKPRVFGEAYRVLKSGGRLAISDVVAFADLPEKVRRDMALYTGCMAGASLVSEVEAMLEENGLTEIRVTPIDESKSFIRDWAPGTDITEYVVSASIEAIKPAT
jgi:arsenite methyltransferase